MNTYEFKLVLTADPDEEAADRLYAIFRDGTVSTVAGIPQIHFHREASSLEAALRSAIDDAQRAGLDVARVELEQPSG